LTRIVPNPTPDPELRTAAINAAAVAGVAYYTELERFRYVLTLGLSHGAVLGELARAAGVSCEQAAMLVNQGEL
jgi:hypothetical protein